MDYSATQVVKSNPLACIFCHNVTIMWARNCLNLSARWQWSFGHWFWLGLGGQEKVPDPWGNCHILEYRLVRAMFLDIGAFENVSMCMSALYFNR